MCNYDYYYGGPRPGGVSRSSENTDNNQLQQQQLTNMSAVVKICDSLSKEVIDSEVSDEHIAEIVRSFHEWQFIATRLELSDVEQDDIKERYPHHPKLQRRKALQIWKQKFGSKATYRKLIEALCLEDQTKAAEELRDLAMKSKENNIIMTFQKYLVDCYSELAHPSSSQWPFWSHSLYIDLELYDAPIDRETSSPESQPPTKHTSDHVKSITLPSLFEVGKSQSKRKVILMEGVAGSGKTTLSWYACSQWAAGKLFMDIKLLIHVSLTDPEFQSANSLADLIPYPTENLRNRVADAITEINGDKVCFLFDAFDEAPPSCLRQKSFLYRFITGKGRTNLPNVSIIIITRPGIPLEYYHCLTGKVDIKGFSLESLNRFIEKGFEESELDKKILVEALGMKPKLQSLCQLPLNITIMSYIFERLRSNLPTTNTDLFHPLICYSIVRHIQTHNLTDDEIEIEKLPDDLPDDIAQLFMNVAEIAYKALIECTKIIDKSLLISSKLSAPVEGCTLGLLQMKRSITMSGSKCQYEFLHLSVQEYLAAVYIIQQDEESQGKAIKAIYTQNPLSPVLTFYAGLTNLRVRNVQDFIFSVLKKKLDILSVLSSVKEHQVPSRDNRRRMLALVNCLYECKNENLWDRVELQEDTESTKSLQRSLEAFNSAVERGNKNYDISKKNFSFPFTYMTLHPTDMLSIGKFARIMCRRLSCESLLYMDFSSCSIGNLEFKALAYELYEKVERSKLIIILDGFNPTKDISTSIKQLIWKQSCIAGLMMANMQWKNHSEKCFFMKSIIEGLVDDSACVMFHLDFSSLDSSLIYYMVLLLRSTDITTLFLVGNDLHIGMFYLSNALKYSKVEVLDLSLCNIDDVALESLGGSLKESSIIHLNIECNSFTASAFNEFLKLQIKNITLRAVGVSNNIRRLNDIQNTLCHVNYFRCSINEALLGLWSHHEDDSRSKRVQDMTNVTQFMKSAPEQSSRTYHHNNTLEN